MTELVLYGDPISPFVRKVEAVLRYKALPFTYEHVNLLDKPDGFYKISPMGRIPVLGDRSIDPSRSNGVIPDSSPICMYLEAKQPLPPILPEDAFDSARTLWLEEFADTNLGGVFRPLIIPLVMKSTPDFDTAKKIWREDIPPALDYLEETLGNRAHFMDSGLTLADIAVAAKLIQNDFITTPFDSERWPGVTAFLARMKSHEVFKANLDACAKTLTPFVSEKFDLN